MSGSGASMKPERKLPVQQLTVLAICRFAEPLATTSILPYLPEMVRSFHVPETEVGKWAGLTAATFSICQAIMGIPWGRASDRFGRKPCILLGLTMTMITSLVWGFSASLEVAILARALSGLGNGTMGIVRTTVAEMVPYKELQPIAFAVMPVVWNIGSIFGPSMGGALANPYKVKPEDRNGLGSLLERYPYALPNIVSAGIFTIGIVIGFLFLEETLETKRAQPDLGLMLGRRIKSRSRRMRLAACRWFSRQPRGPDCSEERERLLKPDDDDLLASSLKSYAPPPWSDVLTRGTVLSLLVYTGLAFHNMAFDQVLPVYMSDKRPPPDAARNDFFNFAGGFGLDNLQLGMLNTAYAIFGMFMQFFVFPPVSRKFGALRCMQVVAAVFPVAYMLMPFTLLMSSLELQVGACFALMLLKELLAVFAFPCSMMLLTNSASSLRILGTVNGIATTTSALGRAAGPASIGALYDAGKRAGYLIVPWWILAGLAMLAAVPAFFAEEGKGFGDDDASVGEREAHERQAEAAAQDAEVSLPAVASGVDGQKVVKAPSELQRP